MHWRRKGKKNDIFCTLGVGIDKIATQAKLLKLSSMNFMHSLVVFKDHYQWIYQCSMAVLVGVLTSSLYVQNTHGSPDILMHMC